MYRREHLGFLSDETIQQFMTGLSHIGLQREGKILPIKAKHCISIIIVEQ